MNVLKDDVSIQLTNLPTIDPISIQAVKNGKLICKHSISNIVFAYHLYNKCKLMR